MSESHKWKPTPISWMSISKEIITMSLHYYNAIGVVDVWMVFLPHSVVYSDDETNQKPKFKRFSIKFAEKVAVLSSLTIYA